MEHDFDKFSFLLALESFENAIKQSIEEIHALKEQATSEFHKGYQFGYVKCLEMQLLAINDMKKMWHE